MKMEFAEVRQKIGDTALVILILLTLLVELFWLGGGRIETLLDGSYRPDSQDYQREDEYYRL